MREICEPHKVEQAVAAVMNADEERIRIARIKYCTRLERTPWKTFLCCALGRKHACEYIDEFPHIIEFSSRKSGGLAENSTTSVCMATRATSMR